MILSLLLMGACERRAEVSLQKNWYDAWLNHSTAETHQEFHSEIEIASGEKARVIINSEVPITVGYFVRDGYEVAKYIMIKGLSLCHNKSSIAAVTLARNG